MFKSQFEKSLVVFCRLSPSKCLRENDLDAQHSATVDDPSQHERKVVAFAQSVCLFIDTQHRQKVQQRALEDVHPYMLK